MIPGLACSLIVSISYFESRDSVDFGFESLLEDLIFIAVFQSLLVLASSLNQSLASLFTSLQVSSKEISISAPG